MEDRSNLADDAGDTADVPRSRRRLVLRVALRCTVAGAGVAALALGAAWGLRERIAGDLIDRELAAQHLPVTYRIESIGLGREVLGAIVVGDPAHPDVTIERAEIALRYGVAGPEIDRITLVRPRFYGRVVGGQLSLGSLDRLIYAPSTAPLRLPDWSLALVDARGRIDSAYGALGVAIDGAGRLSGGFSGKLGAVAPQAKLGPNCTLARTTLYAAITTNGGRPHVAGPLRLGGGQCGTAQKVTGRMAAGMVDLTLAGDAALANWTLGGHLALGRIDSGKALSLAGLGGDAGLHWAMGRNELAGRVSLNAEGLSAPAVRLGSARLDGMVHARQDLAGSGFGLDFHGDIDGRSLARGPAAVAALNRAQASAKGTPLGPLLDRVNAALAREEPGDRVTGSIGVHSDASGWRVAVPSLALRGGRSGQTLARLEQISVTDGSDGVPRLTGNFATGGADMPAITGRMQSGTGLAGTGLAGTGLAATGKSGTHFDLAMAQYAAGGAKLAVPAMAVTQLGNGALTFAGTVAMGGPLQNGQIDNLVMPVEGGVATSGAISLLHRCARPTFDRLRMGTLDLAKGAITVCPTDGAVVRSDGAGTRIAASVPAFALQGRSGGAPLAIRAAGARIAWPGASALDGVDVMLGADRVRMAGVTVATGANGAMAGTFAGGDVAMAATPVVVSAGAGNWALKDGRITLGGGAFTVADTASPARFQPIGVHNATMTLAQGAVDAQAQIVAPSAGQDIADVALHHDLNSGKGHADVVLTGLTFRDPSAKAENGPAQKTPALQPADLSLMAKGIIANASGTIAGKARFDWNTALPHGGVTSSGTFSSDDFDFAAAMGPVEGLSGTLQFTDLINLVTAPHQQLKIASINPGIEVVNGVVDLELHKGLMLQVNSAKWPFEGGALQLEPATLHLGSTEPYTFALAISGLEAGRFLQHINMSNLSATGLFDGRIPLVFDANGGRIKGGQLISRPPGGNVSYVGALSYKDLSPMANYAFRMLRSVDYATMTIALDGDLAGEIITRVSFGGIHQGAGAQTNFVTRQIAKLPLQFNVNVRAQFYQLLGSLRSLYDPTLVRDPRSLGLVDAQGRPVHQHHGQVTVGPATPPVIQPQASGTMP